MYISGAMSVIQSQSRWQLIGRRALPPPSHLRPLGEIFVTFCESFPAKVFDVGFPTEGLFVRERQLIIMMPSILAKTKEIVEVGRLEALMFVQFIVGGFLCEESSSV